MNNTNIENVALKFAILLILVYDIFRTLATEYMELRLVNSSLVKYSVANVLNILYTKTSKITNFSATFLMLVLFISRLTP